MEGIIYQTRCFWDIVHVAHTRIFMFGYFQSPLFLEQRNRVLSLWFTELFMIWWASLVAQLVKNLLARQETWVWSLGWEDPLEKGKATHSSILPWRIPWTEKPGELQSIGSQSVGHDGLTDTVFFLDLDPARSPRLASSRKWKSLSHVRLFATSWTT